jgi:3',5'-cyclic AMP phosphodiesterase CpdA
MTLVNKLSILLIVLILGSSCFAFSQTPDASPEAMSPPPLTSEETFSFVVFGDNRDGDEIFVDLINKVNQEKDVSFALNTGDLVSHGRKKEYENYLKMVSSLKIKLYHVPGNHDLYSLGFKHFKEHFGPFYYSFDYKNSHFVVINNAFKTSFDFRQFEWLKKDLAATEKENIFVFMHRPTFDPSEIYKGYVMSGRKTIEELMRTFKKYKVDYVFAGHIHGYARAKRDGIVYIVTGGAGAPLYLPKDFGGFNHYVKVRVEGKRIVDEAVRIYE